MFNSLTKNGGIMRTTSQQQKKQNAIKRQKAYENYVKANIIYQHNLQVKKSQIIKEERRKSLNNNNEKEIVKKKEVIQNKVEYEKNLDTKVSIVMGYYNRKTQTLNTLKDFEKYSDKYNFEVIIVDDASNKENELDNIIKNYNIDIKLLKITTQEKGSRINSCVVYNKGFRHATGDIIIIQNPECYHVGDILGYVLTHLEENKYFAFSCFSANTEEFTKEMINSGNIFKYINDKNFLEKNGKACYFDNLNWFNHPYIRPKGYHFCSAIHRKKLLEIGGFDERFKDGHCFDDDELLLSIRYILKLNVFNIPPENGFVIHQYHSRTQYNIKNLMELYHKNRNLFLQKAEKIKLLTNS
jgi:hypothetical protein